VLDSYLMCGTPRTGSTLLCALLASTGVTREILGFLGLEPPPGWAASAPNRRLADDLTEEWVARYHAKSSDGPWTKTS